MVLCGYSYYEHMTKLKHNYNLSPTRFWDLMEDETINSVVNATIPYKTGQAKFFLIKEEPSVFCPCQNILLQVSCCWDKN